MKTKFGSITNAEISARLASYEDVLTHDGYSKLPLSDDVGRIGYLAQWMLVWKAWPGPPVTYYEHDTLEYDGQHRVRAAKFLAHVRRLQVQIPVRYAIDQ